MSFVMLMHALMLANLLSCLVYCFLFNSQQLITCLIAEFCNCHAVSLKGEGCYMGEELLERKGRNLGSRIGHGFKGVA